MMDHTSQQNAAGRSVSPESGTVTPELFHGIGGSSRATSPPQSGNITPDCGNGVYVHIDKLGGSLTPESGNVSPVWLSDCVVPIRPASPTTGRRTWLDDAVIDIGGGNMQETLHMELDRKFLWKDGVFQAERVMPASVLHDEQGLKMWQQMNRLPNYYQTRDEIALLEENGNDLAELLEDGVALVDLGSGDIRKIKPLLLTLAARGKPFRYYALDLSRSVLEESTQALRELFADKPAALAIYGLWGTFDHGLEFVRKLESPKCYISLGSMFGNDHFKAATDRLRAWSAAMGPRDRMLLGLDSCQNAAELWASYHDEDDLFEAFIRNGFRCSNHVLGCTWFRDEDWIVTGELLENPTMHRFAVVARKPVKCEALDLEFAKGDKIVCYEGFKYEPAQMQLQFAAADLKQLELWPSPSGRIYQYLLRRASSGK